MFDSLNVKHVEKLMYADFYFLKKRNLAEISEIKEKWLRELLHCDVNFAGNQQTDFVFFRSLRRPDYRHLLHTIAGQCNYEKILIEDFLIETPTINLEASEFLSKNYSLAKYFSNYPEGVVSALAIRFIYYCFIVEKLLSIKASVFVSFADMQPLDYLASICFKQLGVTTCTLQHGLYIEYKELDTLNVVNYLNQPSDYFLSWGKNTKALIEKYHPDAEVVICGKPDLDKIPPTQSNSILVIFDQEIFREKNILMYKIADKVASSLGLEISVRFHPHNNIPSYHKVLGTLKETKQLHCHSFIIGHTSSLLYEMQACGQTVMQFKSDIPTINLDSKFQFVDESQLLEIVDKCSNEKINVDNSLISSIGNDSKASYRTFFDSIAPLQMDRPFFSIIIPCFNSAMTIAKSINSLKKQSYTDFEVLIMDGQSDDATIPVALSYIDQDKRFLIHSSPDVGTYDAMNKGMEKARGAWVYFMGSDDCFKDADVLSDIHKKIIEHSDEKLGMLYGNVQVVGDVKWAKDGTIYDGEFDTEKIKVKNICHQAIFYNRSLKRGLGAYNLKYRLCADWDMNLRVWSSSDTLYLDRVIAEFHAGGQSTDGSDAAFGKDIKKNIEKYFSSTEH